MELATLPVGVGERRVAAAVLRTGVGNRECEKGKKRLAQVPDKGQTNRVRVSKDDTEPRGTVGREGETLGALATRCVVHQDQMMAFQMCGPGREWRGTSAGTRVDV